MTTIVFIVVFTNIAGIPTDGAHPVVFYMSGLTVWSYFSSCLTATSSTFVSNAGIFGKVYFPRLVTPCAVVLSNLVKFLIQFGLLVVVMVYFSFNGYPVGFGWNVVWLPVLMACLACLSLGLGIIISSLTTKYRDFGVLVGFGVQLLMYATPVAYPVSYLKQNQVLRILELNPLTPLFEAFRYVMLGSGTFTIGQLVYAGFSALLILLVGLMLFNRVEKSFMDTV
jgi:lipopolysaccharide transport system permease protein